MLLSSTLVQKYYPIIFLYVQKDSIIYHTLIDKLALNVVERVTNVMSFLKLE